jgi:hypothetical protein
MTRVQFTGCHAYVHTSAFHDYVYVGRFATEEGSMNPATTSLATCTAHLCETHIAKVHDAIQDASAALDPIVSLVGRPNDENVTPSDIMGASPAEDHLEESNTVPTKPTHERPPLLHQLHVLHTFSACLYTQDIVSEVFVHSIIDHVRYSSSSWPQIARDSAISSICDMTLFCGKRLESFGTLRSAMPDLYSHLELLTQGSSIGEATKTRIHDTISLRARHWVDPPPHSNT